MKAQPGAQLNFLMLRVVNVSSSQQRSHQFFSIFVHSLHAPCSAHSIAHFPAWSILAGLLLGGRFLEAVFIVPINLDSWNDGSCHGGPRGLFEPPTDPSTFNPSLPLAVVSQHSTLVPYDAYSHQLHDRAYTICDSAWRHPVLLCLQPLQYRASAHTVIPDGTSHLDDQCMPKSHYRYPSDPYFFSLAFHP